MNEFGRNLKRTLMRSRMTQAELAQRLGLAASAISHWTHGKNTPTYANVQRIASVLNCSVEELAGKRDLPVERESDLVALYRLLDEAGREAVISIAQRLSSTRI